MHAFCVTCEPQDPNMLAIGVEGAEGKRVDEHLPHMAGSPSEKVLIGFLNSFVNVRIGLSCLGLLQPL